MFTRILTGTILIPIVVWLVLYGPAALLSAVITIITLIALWEYNNFVLKEPQDKKTSFNRTKQLTIVLGGLTPFMFLLWGGVLTTYLVLVLFIIIFSATIGRGSFDGVLEEISLRCFSIIYIALPLSYMMGLAFFRTEVFIVRHELMLAFVIVWANDTFAYFGGKLLGKNKLAPSISPGKTIEGAVIGILGGVGAVYLYNSYIYTDLFINTAVLVVFSVVLGVLSIMGDLSESIIKRSACVKDSGTLLPGHGGMLDRIDSLIFVVPAIFFYSTFVSIFVNVFYR